LTGRERAALLAREGLQRLHKGEMLALFHRVDTALGRRPGRAVLFVAAHSGAGSSSIAHGYGQVATQDRRVLILDAREPQPDEFVPPMSVAAAVLSGCGVADTAELLAPGLYHNLLMAPGMQERTAALVKDERFWRSMVAEFDEVVIDSPAVTESQIGLVMSSRADGVVVVVEAEATRKSQVLRLMEDLHMFHAQVLGTVFNKRTYHMPRWLYRRLA
jgi:Mrp family chromosome partitioning ATPase